MLLLGHEPFFLSDMGISVPAARISQLEGALVGKGWAGEGSHCGQGTGTSLEEALVGEFDALLTHGERNNCEKALSFVKQKV